MNSLLTKEEFLAQLHAVGERAYHHKHPFHLMMHEGRLSREQLQAWAVNRYAYQAVIPQKDAIILSRAEDMEFRRAWRKRVEDHDGREGDRGGLEKWIQLAEVTGARREDVVAQKSVLPGVRFAVQGYLQFVRERPFMEAVASSLTELFSAKLISLRMQHLETKYPWMKPGLEYFQARLTQAPEDVSFAIDYLCANIQSREEQQSCIRALETKCQILWAQLDAVYFAYVDPKLPPPGFSNEL